MGRNPLTAMDKSPHKTNRIDNFMRFNSTLASLIAALVIVMSIASCGNIDYRKSAIGQFGDVTVVMDSSAWQSATANAIRNTFGAGIGTLPTPEPRFDLKFVDFRTQDKLEQLKRMKNVIFAAPLDQQTTVGQFVRDILGEGVEREIRNGNNFAIPLHDKWYRNQWSLILTSTSDSTLAQKIREAGEPLVNNLEDVELERWKNEIYDRGEQLALEDSIWNEHGWKIRIQHDYQLNIDTTDVVTLHRYLPKNDRWIWAWWKDDVKDISFLDDEWINNKRDSLMKIWVRGTRDSSYVTTEYRRPVETKTMRVNGYYTYLTRGTWRMTHDFMGGPFVNYTYYDDQNDRLFMVEFMQFAPKYNKRRFVRQFLAMGRTFQADSTWNQKAENVKPAKP